MTGAAEDPRVQRHIVAELGLAVVRHGDGLRGSAQVTPHMHVPGTAHLRTSILATWADTITGLLAMELVRPLVPVTLDLDVHLYRPAPGSGAITGTSRTIKAGRSVFVARAEFTTGQGEPVAVASASFMTSRDPRARAPETSSLDLPAAEELLSVPFAERAGCRRLEPGVAVLPRSEDGLNSANTVNGGLIALVAEEAVLSLTAHETVRSLAVRYLQPARQGPVVATARLHQGVAQVEVRDAGSDDRLSAIATAGTGPP